MVSNFKERDLRARSLKFLGVVEVVFTTSTTPKFI